jgi:hypothetical protein
LKKELHVNVATAIGCAVVLVASLFAPRTHASDLADFLIEEKIIATQTAMRLAPLKTAKDVRMHVASTAPQLSPLQALAPAERPRFIKSLKFNDKGLVEFDYTTLAGLNSDDIYRVLALFGLQSGAAQLSAQDPGYSTQSDGGYDQIGDGFAKDYRCVSRATCQTAWSYACTSNC